jgi:acid phosphatase
LAEGSHTFTVRATDPAGNPDPTPASRTWTVDLQGGTAFLSDGFETGSFSAWTTVSIGGDGAAVVQSTTVKTGAFAAQVSETSNTGSLAYIRKTLPSSRPDLTVSGDFRVLAEGASGGNVPFIRFFDSSGNRLVSLYRLNLNGSRIGLTYGGVFYTTTATLPLNTWGQMSLRLVVNGTGASTVEVKLNGALIYSTTTASFTAGVRSLQIGNETAKQAGTIVADNIQAADSAAPPSPPATSTVPAFDHIFVVVEENKRFDQIIGSSAAPYINSLASQYGLAANYKPITHPSLPNYLALIGGSTFGITTDCSPTGTGSCPVNASNLADRIESSGRTWKGYFDAMPLPCETSTVGTYVPRHNPFVYFDDIRTNSQRCVDNVVPYSRLATDLQSTSTTPSFAFIVPDQCNNMHDCPISTGDDWLRTNLATLFNSPAWTTQNSLLVITWDEDDEIAGGSGNVATILVGPSVRRGLTSYASRNHYSLLRTIEGAWSLASLTTNDSAASPLADFFTTGP